ncbi:MAG TPA: SpoVR family protein [Planctomycetota bacterium]|jgi:stage V sporulation protein R|nr:SpoVR family protein [Planctomycetota bacterium]
MTSAKTLPPALQDQARRIEAVARDAGLDFFEVHFEMLDAKDVNAIASYGGFPVRYPSWRFGMEYERMEKGRKYGLARIYELVINNDPAVAYLVRTNSGVEQKLVMAHVFGHADFFRHNVWFAPTDRKMLDRMADHGARLRGFIDDRGQDQVEMFLDRALSIDSLLDPFLPLAQHLQKRNANGAARELVPSRPTLDEVLAAPTRGASSAGAPTYDVIGFLAERAPLEPWQREILRIVRAEAYYFAPQRMTRIMNEGWASYWHSRILTGGVLDASELIDFADCHSGATAAAPGQLNPYKLGIELYRMAEARGMDLFRLRRIHNDASFVDALVDEEFAEKSELFVYGKNGRTGRTEVLERSFGEVKEKLLQELAWGGLPQIELASDDHEGKGELLLVHHHDGRDLELASAGETLKGIAGVWGRPAHLVTQEEGQGRRLTSDGVQVKVTEVAAAGSAPKTEAG